MKDDSNKKKLDEATLSGVGPDDGPSFMYPSHDIYKNATTKDLEKYIETGWNIVSHMIDDGTEEDMMARVYPDGPVGSVSFFPAGDIDDLTPNNQENLFGSEAYEKWKKHTLDTIAKVGWEWIHTRDEDEDAEMAVDDAEDLEGEAEEQAREEERKKEKIKEAVEKINGYLDDLMLSESVKSLGNQDLSNLIDILSNSMEEYEDEDAFIDDLTDKTNYPEDELRVIYDQYWELEPKKRMMYIGKDWKSWLHDNDFTLDRSDDAEDGDGEDDNENPDIVDIRAKDDKKMDEINEEYSKGDKVYGKPDYEYQDSGKRAIAVSRTASGGIGAPGRPSGRKEYYGYIVDRNNKVIKPLGKLDKRNFKKDLERKFYKSTINLTGEAISKGFTKAVEKFREEQLKLQQLRDKQKELVDKFKKSDAKGKKRLKKDLVKMHRAVKKQQDIVDRAESKFNKAVMDEPEELEEGIKDVIKKGKKFFSKKKDYDEGDPLVSDEIYMKLKRKEDGKGKLSAIGKTDDGKFYVKYGSKDYKYDPKTDMLVKENVDTRRGVAKFVNTFNNTKKGKFGSFAGNLYYIFLASKFAADGIKRELKKVGLGDKLKFISTNKWGIKIDDETKQATFRDGKVMMESINEGTSDGHISMEGDTVYVDTNFVNKSKGVLPNSELKHMGMGEFYLDTPDGEIQFIRTNKDIDNFVGRTHRVKDDRNGKLIAKLIAPMMRQGKAIKESIMNEAYPKGKIDAKKLADKMRKVKTMKGLADKIEKKGGKISADELDKMLPDYVPGKHISKLFEIMTEANDNIQRGSLVNVSAENKSGVVLKVYGRKVHVAFPDDTEKTYNANELTVIEENTMNEEGNMRDDVKRVVDKVTKAYKVEPDGVLKFRSEKDAEEAYEKLSDAGIAASHSKGRKYGKYVYLESIQSSSLSDLLSEKKFYGWYNKEKKEVDASSLYDAKKKLIKKFGIPRSKESMLAVKSAKSMEKGDFRFEGKLNEDHYNKGDEIPSDKVLNSYEGGRYKAVVVKRGETSPSGDEFEVYIVDNNNKVIGNAGSHPKKNPPKSFLKKMVDKVNEVLTETVQPSDTMKKILDIVQNKQHQKVDGQDIDLTTAGIIKQVWEKANRSQREKLNKLKAGQLANLAYKMIK